MNKRISQLLFLLTVSIAGLLSSVGGAQGQGVTTAAVSGRITGPDGAPLPSIEVRITNEATGLVRTTLSNAQGLYLVPGLPVGGPYRVEASGIGYGQQSREGIRLTLGQNLQASFQLQVQAVALQALEASATRTQSQIITPSRTGQAQLVTEQQLQNLPTITRNFTDFIQLSPLVGAGGGATSVGAQNNRFNNIQIDGAITQDLFGLGSTGQPGGQADARSISLEAVREYQVLAAPYDVRQSGFSGGLINAVTKSGTNEFHGSVYGFQKTDDLARGDLTVGGETFRIGEFTNRLYGGTVGGPIIRDRAHFFVAAEFETDERPATGNAIGREAESVTGIAQADADRFAQALRGQGVDPGSYGPREDRNPNNNIFVRVDAQLSQNHQLTLRHNWVRAEDDIVVNRAPGSNYSFDSNWYFFESSTNSSVLNLNSTFGGFYNELTAGYTRIRDRRTPTVTYPVVQVSVPDVTNPTRTKRLIAGAEYFSQGNELDQDAFELTNNLSWTAGSHRITVGGHAEYFKFRNLFQAGKTGEWTFNSLADLEAKRPSGYRRSVPAAGIEDPNARNSLMNVGFYAQTEWTGIPNLTVTAGLRYDVALTLGDMPFFNQLVLDSLGRRTDEIPSGKAQFSPRLGFNYDVYGDQTFQLRGGVGLFTGRHPYVWISNLYGNTGVSTVTISCSASANNMPGYTLDPDNQPATCANTGIPSPPRPVVNLIDPDFKYPQNLRASIGADRVLPFGIVGTVDFMYTKAIKQIFLRELNVDFDHPVSFTQGGRPVFGTHQALTLPTGASNTNVAQPKRFTRAIDAAVELTNSNRDRSWSITGQLQKRYANGLDLNVSYTYMDAQDISGLTSSIATSNIGFNPVQGSPNDPILSTSDYETRHKIVLSGAYDITPWFTASMFYVGASGDGYSYVYDGDVNADGYEASYASNRFNDLLYVPKDAHDITLVDPAAWTALSKFIESEDCLRRNKGRILERNACSEPWQNRLDARFTFRVPTMRLQRAEVTLDVLNVLNLLNEQWGVNRGIPNPTAELLELRGWDPINNRGIFQPTGYLKLDKDGRANPYQTFLSGSSSSRWQMQLGVKYVF